VLLYLKNYLFIKSISVILLTAPFGFYWYAPRSVSERGDPVPMPVPSILVVARNSAVRELISQTLARAGFAVLEVGNAVDGLRQFHDHQDEISLAVIDMTVPAADGLDLAAELVRQCPRLKVLYLSGYASSIAVAGINSRSPEAILIKPFTGRMLVEHVAILLQGGVGEAEGPPQKQRLHDSRRCRR
jgi:two-component system, cell cycle sensor histidine kinase and response regulator CckA